MMSLTVVSNPEKLTVAQFDRVFSAIESEDAGAEITKTTIGYLENDRLARIIRKADKTIEGEAPQHTYEVDLAYPDPYRPIVKIVMSAIWKVSPQLAAAKKGSPESKNDELYALYHPKMQRELESPEDIFDWFDNDAEKQIPHTSVTPEPNIFIASGMEELLRYGNFKGIK